MHENFVNVGYEYQLTLNHLLEHAAKLHLRRCGAEDERWQVRQEDA